jgi:hypothetical protein
MGAKLHAANDTSGRVIRFFLTAGPHHLLASPRFWALRGVNVSRGIASSQREDSTIEKREKGQLRPLSPVHEGIRRSAGLSRYSGFGLSCSSAG